VQPTNLLFRFFTPMREEFVPDLVLGVANLRRDLLLALRGSIFPEAVDVLLVPNLTASQYVGLLARCGVGVSSVLRPPSSVLCLYLRLWSVPPLVCGLWLSVWRVHASVVCVCVR
jgi:hypothetical protein